MTELRAAKLLKGKGKTYGKQNPCSSTSTTSWSTTSKSGKGGDQNDKGKGKSKSKDGVTCFNCGRVGHMAKDCWRVRQVGNPEASSTVLSSVTGQESVGPSVSQAATAVKRVAFSAGEHEPVVFDMRSSSTSSWCHCRMVKFFYIDNEEYKPMSIRSTTFGGETNERYELDTNERYELDTNEVDIIIDSGADAPIFSSSMIHCGRQCDGQQVALQDAQGREIPLLGQRSVAVVLEDKNGVEIEVRDNVVFSDEISQPILSFERLMNAGWSICAQTRSLRNGAYEIPLDFQNNSLIVRGHVRTIGEQPQAIRALKADLAPGLQAYVDNAFGWHRDGTRWVGVHLSDKYDFVNAWESEDVEMIEEKAKDVNDIEALWSDDPSTRSPPEPLPEVDRLADEIEVNRLQEMGVIEKLALKDYELELLTTRMVYDWRIKDCKDPKTGSIRRRWMRRARLVAREYANHRRDDVHSPASGSQVLRLLPAIYLMLTAVDGIDQEEIQIGSLDIKDAFLMADQEEPLQVTTKVGKFKVKKNLPGQRKAARSWYEFIANYLEKKGMTFCPENPCLGRRGGGLFLLLHVDDMMFCGMKSEVEKLIQELKSELNISYKIAQHEGDQFEFLKRKYVLREDGIDILPGGYAETMIEAFEKRYGPVKLQQVPCGDDAQEISTSGPWLMEGRGQVVSITGWIWHLPVPRAH